MADALRPASLLLGAVCLWAACLLMLAFAGLGARVADSGVAAEPPPIPQVALAPVPSRLGPLLDYAEVGQRPLTTRDRRPAPVALAGTATDELDVVLTSVLLTPRLQLAILTNTQDQRAMRVRVGENVEGTNWRLASLEPRKALLEGPSGQRSLDLRVFDGSGGEAPTALATAAAPDAPNPNADGDRPRPVVNGQIPGGVAPSQAARPPTVNPTPVRPEAATTTTAAAQPPTTQEAQIEAIRRRIEARRAQMRAEAAAAGNQQR